MGPNVLLTIRGRTSGQPRTAPVAIAEIDGRRFIIGAYGEVQWVRNLRAAGEADIAFKGRTEHVLATELRGDDALGFFRDLLPSFIGRFPVIARGFARILFGLMAPEILGDPVRAAATRPVFELRPA
jgi:deazaflavin-dependent oxidoreductase (nitroreductase family)